MTKKPVLLPLVAMLSIQGIHAQVDTLNTYSLKEVSVSAVDDSTLIHGNLSETMIWSTESLNRLPELFGTTDPMHYLQFLPCVQTTSELQGGLFVSGTDSYHTLVSMDGIPVYNPYHFLGLFSVFNSNHFNSVRFSTTCHVSGANRLGGMMDMVSHSSLPEKVTVDVSVGMMSSSGTLRFPVGKRSALSVSGRVTYLNSLYEKLINRNDNFYLRYGFYDVNASWLTQWNDKDALSIDFYHGKDNLGLDYHGVDMEGKGQWGNTVCPVRWKHGFSNGYMEHTLYITSYRNLDRFGFVDRSLTLTSDILDAGYKGLRNISLENCMIKYGLEYTRHSLQPQNLEIEGIKSSVATDTSYVRSSVSHETSLFAEASFVFSPKWQLEGGIRASVFSHPSYDAIYWGLDPEAALTYTFDDASYLKFLIKMSHQYLHRVGFTYLGLPVDFWMASSDKTPPQKSLAETISYTRNFLGGVLSLSVQAYYRQMYGQVEYNTSVLEFLSGRNDVYKSLLHGDGYACGAGVMLTKNAGRFTGWLSYTFNRTQMLFDGMDHYCPSYYERPNDLNILATYHLNDHWSFSIDGVWASGTPYTKPKYLYIQNGNIICQYGDYNGARYSDYWRVDASVDWTIQNSDKLKYGLNFSLYNMLFSKNVSGYMFRYQYSSDLYTYTPFCPIETCLPSISFFIHF